MPTLRPRGGTSTPSAGPDTIAPPMRTTPALGCSRPATQRNVVVLPQPEGPSRATISPAPTEKLTSATAGAPVAKTLRKRSTRSSADMVLAPLTSPRKAGRGREGGLPAAVVRTPTRSVGDGEAAAGEEDGRGT